MYDTDTSVASWVLGCLWNRTDFYFSTTISASNQSDCFIPERDFMQCSQRSWHSWYQHHNWKLALLLHLHEKGIWPKFIHIRCFQSNLHLQSQSISHVHVHNRNWDNWWLLTLDGMREPVRVWELRYKWNLLNQTIFDKDWLGTAQTGKIRHQKSGLQQRFFSQSLDLIWPCSELHVA